jgi:hypothetical protein
LAITASIIASMSSTFDMGLPAYHALHAVDRHVTTSLGRQLDQLNR